MLGCIYRPPPSTNFLNNSFTDSEIVNSIVAAKQSLDSKKFDGLVIVGDFNFRYIKFFSDNTVSVFGPDDSPGNRFIGSLNDMSLRQLVNFPTFRKADGTMTNTLDYLIKDSPERISTLYGSAPLGSSNQGHLTLTWDYELENTIENVISSRKFKYRYGDYTKMQCFMPKLTGLIFSGIKMSRNVTKFSQKNTKRPATHLYQKKTTRVKKNAPLG